MLHKSKNTQDFDLSSTQGFKHKKKQNSDLTESITCTKKKNPPGVKHTRSIGQG